MRKNDPPGADFVAIEREIGHDHAFIILRTYARGCWRELIYISPREKLPVISRGAHTYKAREPKSLALQQRRSIVIFSRRGEDVEKGESLIVAGANTRERERERERGALNRREV